MRNFLLFILLIYAHKLLYKKVISIFHYFAIMILYMYDILHECEWFPLMYFVQKN